MLAVPRGNGAGSLAQVADDLERALRAGRAAVSERRYALVGRFAGLASEARRLTLTGKSRVSGRSKP
jgi:hypothetical protein